MTATMLSMEWVPVDKLTPNQLEPDDVILIEDELYTVFSTDATDNGWYVACRDEYGEFVEFEFDDNDKLPLMMID